MMRSQACGAGPRATAASCPEVDRTTWPTPSRRSSPARSARSSAAASANRSRSARDDVSTRTSRPVSASISVSSPTSVSSSSRGSRISTARTWCRAATAPSAAGQSRGPRKSDTSTTRPPRGAAPATRRSAPAGDRAPTGPCGVGPGGPFPARAARRRPGRRRYAPRGAARAGPAGRPSPASAGRAAHRTSAARGGCRAAWRRGRTPPPTPSATSALRRSAVPNVIDGETSRSSHVVRARSGTWTRTWGIVVRAVTFQSIRRTSSPGSYGRTWASSVPPPRSWARYSPGTRPRIRRPTVTSSARRSASGVGPGPGCAGERGRASAARLMPSAHAATASTCPALSCGAGTTGTSRSRIMSAETSSASAAKLGTIRWRRTSWASSVTSDGMTYRRPRTSASARAAWIRLIEPRGLAPKAMKGFDLGQPDRAGVARRGGQGDRVVDDRAVHVDVRGQRLELGQPVGRQDRRHLRCRAERALDDDGLLGRASGSRRPPSS